jgi:ABC-type bacteriocin/lantibiotic exporter with double-glycine peptidase domain
MMRGLPFWRRVGGRGRHVPFVPQMEAADCGAACLAMALGYLGRATRLDEVGSVVDAGRDGLDGAALLRGAEHFGLRGRGVRLDIADLCYLPCGSILHWELKHFVVYERQVRGAVQIVDPASGRRLVPMKRFSSSFTGVAFVFEKTNALTPRAKGRSSTDRFVSELLSLRWPLARVLALSIALRLAGLSLPLATAMVIDRVIPGSDFGLLGLISAGLGVVVSFVGVSTLIRARVLLMMRTQLDTRMTLGFVEHLVALPYSYFQRRGVGDLAMRVAANANLREILTTTTLSSLLDGTLTAIYLVACFLINTSMALLALCLGAVQVGIFLVTRSRTHELAAQGLEAQAHCHSCLVQMLNGIETLKATGSEKQAVTRWSNLFIDQVNLAVDRGRLMAVIDSIGAAVSSAAPLALVAFGAAHVLEGSMALGTMLAVVAMATGFLLPLRTLMESALLLQNFASYAERVDDVLSTEPEQDRRRVVAAPKLSGGIELSGISFRYSQQGPSVLSDVSLRIEPGETVAMVGRSGSGKSTLGRLMIGLLAPTQGKVLYDGQDLATLELNGLRRQIGVVPQAPHIFSGSVRDNVALCVGEAADDVITAAARRACIHDEIAAMPMNYDTPIADGGATLSGGQRQRLALARALLNEPALLLLDEATSSLDAATERAVMRSLSELRCTRIVIAHRLSTVVDADRIFVFEAGRLVESGKHPALLRLRGVYWSLLQAQLRQDGEASAPDQIETLGLKPGDMPAPSRTPTTPYSVR